MAPWLNALDLVRSLQPLKAELDIVCHSRGGLVVSWALQLAPLPVQQVVFVGSPHQGAPLERAGHGVDLLLGAAPARFEPPRHARRTHIVVLDDGSEAGRQAQRVAAQLAQALGARLETRKLATQPATAAQAGEADLLVLPAAALGALPADRPQAPLLLEQEPPPPVSSSARHPHLRRHCSYHPLNRQRHHLQNCMMR